MYSVIGVQPREEVRNRELVTGGALTRPIHTDQQPLFLEAGQPFELEVSMSDLTGTEPRTPEPEN